MVRMESLSGRLLRVLRRMDSGGYEHKPDVDMSGYVPLDDRVIGACRCENCSSNSVIKRWHKNDLVCRFDHDLCHKGGKCYTKKRVWVGIRKGRAVYRVLTVKCERYANGLK